MDTPRLPVPIGEAARRCGVATSTLRYYEERALVSPSRRSGGRRWYGQEDLRRIVVVQLAQRFGMSLEAVASMLNDAAAAWRAVLDDHLAELDDRIACAVAAKRVLGHARDCPAPEPLRDCPVLAESLDAWIARGVPGSVPGSGLASGLMDAHDETGGTRRGPRSAGEEPPFRPEPPLGAEPPFGSEPASFEGAAHRSAQPPQLPSAARLAELRRRYGRGELVESELPGDPLVLFHTWLADALAEGVPEPNAMVVATVGADGLPSARTVLLKGLDERGFVFYTNYDSAKAADLDAHPNAALVFPWHAMERQVRVTGSAGRVSREESAAYFASRPLESRLGAWASPQSQVVADRESLDRAYAETAERFAVTEDVPIPDFWGGYRVRPEVVEFWQGRQGRMHDRIRYRRTEGTERTGEQWIVERLAP